MMAAPAFHGRTLTSMEEDSYAAAFERTGFCVIPAALTAAEVEAGRAAVWRNREEQPGHWRLLGRSRDGGPIGESGCVRRRRPGVLARPRGTTDVMVSKNY